jgi:hypothetical protein
MMRHRPVSERSRHGHEANCRQRSGLAIQRHDTETAWVASALLPRAWHPVFRMMQDSQVAAADDAAVENRRFGTGGGDVSRHRD